MGNTIEKETPKKHKFGCYKNQNNPRPGYYKTPSEVYYRGELIQNATPSTFRKLGNSWAKDNQYVYFQGKIINNADHKTFQVINKIAKDKSGEWYRGKKVT
jgi:hypothetical protein